MRFSYFLPMILTLLVWQCGDNASSPETEPPAAEAAAETTAPAPQTITATQAPANPYPSVTPEMMMNLYNNCDYIDFVFYGTNFSMSQNQQNAIRNTLAGISTQPAQVFDTCQPVGRVFFQIEGQNAEEADLFFGGNCLYYLFLKDGKYAHGNQLTEGGFAFYQKIFAQAAAQ